jgi:4-amino-4-deoxy-L-arabinose transferase-like glycosyltransferase
MLAISIAIAAAWYVPAFMIGHRNDFGGVFIDENFGHFMPASMGGTGEAARPVYYIVARLAGGMMPLTFMVVPLAFAFAFGRFEKEARNVVLYQTAMALSVILLFSIASAKRDDYILPAIPPLAIVFAAVFTTRSNRSVPAILDAAKTRDGICIAVSAVIALATLGLLLALRGGGNFVEVTMMMQSSDATYASIFARGLASLTLPFVFFIAAVVIAAAICVIGTIKMHPLITGGGFATVCLACSLLWTGLLRPLEATTRCVGPFAAEVHRRVGDAPLYVAYPDPEFAWFYGYGVPSLPRSIARNGPFPGSSIFLVARARDQSRLSPVVRKDLELVFRSNLPIGGGAPNLYRLHAG